jgi:hypothetical protein
METLAEFEAEVIKLTPYQRRVLETIEKSPNELANTWEVVRNGFAKEWNEKASSHGAIFRCIVQAAHIMQKKGLIVILPPRDQHSTYTFAGQRKWYTVRNQQRAQQSVQRIGSRRCHKI